MLDVKYCQNCDLELLDCDIDYGDYCSECRTEYLLAQVDESIIDEYVKKYANDFITEGLSKKDFAYQDELDLADFIEERNFKQCTRLVNTVAHI